MTQPTKPNRKTDELLADFTDRVLEGKTAVLASSDEELRGLEDMVVRLQQGLPQGAMDEKVRQRLARDFKARARNQTPSQTTWRSRKSRQRLVLAFVAVVVIAAIFLLTPFLTSSPGSVQATAGFQTPGLLLFAGVVVVIGLVIWLARRK